MGARVKHAASSAATFVNVDAAIKSISGRTPVTLFAESALVQLMLLLLVHPWWRLHKAHSFTSIIT